MVATQESNTSHERGSERAPDPNPGAESIPRQSVVEWVAEQDSAIAGALQELIERRPDMFKTDAEQLEYAIKLASLQGKRELLEDAVGRLQNQADEADEGDVAQ